MQPPLVSIALCTYNGESFMRQQIDSILNQTYKNLEIIIVDDHSTDNSYTIAAEYAAKDSRVKCFLNDINLGYNKNFAKAVRLTTGSYIAISDQDDIWELNKIQRLLDNIGDHWLIFSNSAMINDAGELQEKKLLHNFNYGDRDFRGILLTNFVTGHTSLMAREFLDYIFPFPDAGYYDWWMGFIAIYHHKLIYLEEVLTIYRLHEKSVTQQNIRQDKQAALDIIYRITTAMLRNFLSYKGLTDNDRETINKVYNAYARKKKYSYNLPLITLIVKYYPIIFPDIKLRTGLSRLNYAIKFSRKVNDN
jgi:glycosyltransferase involved in cell wall biosynthesis